MLGKGVVLRNYLQVYRGVMQHQQVNGMLHARIIGPSVGY